MNDTLTKFASDSVLAGGTSFTTGAILTTSPTDIHTIYIPLITGILAPLIKEIIVTLREARRLKRECKNKNT